MKWSLKWGNPVSSVSSRARHAEGDSKSTPAKCGSQISIHLCQLLRRKAHDRTGAIVSAPHEWTGRDCRCGCGSSVGQHANTDKSASGCGREWEKDGGMNGLGRARVPARGSIEIGARNRPCLRWSMYCLISPLRKVRERARQRVITDHNCSSFAQVRKFRSGSRWRVWFKAHVAIRNGLPSCHVCDEIPGNGHEAQAGLRASQDGRASTTRARRVAVEKRPI
ncbi:hypothetical protein B0T14DRAFT_299974 [Immersiella caudata]|uniref:Uncharacterized protein n=1 Tax=Immersiella caudata TaxID=314043 RepID=A0AA39WF39_9PEZI|nr:hypothetical protein B0T14DRAFT_299974 [Immersiella caudata]